MYLKLLAPLQKKSLANFNQVSKSSNQHTSFDSKLLK